MASPARTLRPTARPENLVAATVTAIVAVAIGTLSLVPQHTSVELDFGEIMPSGHAHQVTLTGMPYTPNRGWVLFGGRGEIFLHRPLPHAFELEVEAWRWHGREPATLEVEIGGERASLVFGPERAARTARIETDAHAREISLRVPGGADLQLAHMSIRPLESP